MELLRRSQSMAVGGAKGSWKITRTAQERHRRRIVRLRSLLDEAGKNIDAQAASARHLLWEKRQPQSIRVRQGLVLRQGRDASPLREVSASRSAAVQLLLLAIFENQCRPARRDGYRTPVPLQDADAQTETAWRYLIALPTVDLTSELTQARMPVENRIEQLKNALDRLEEFRRVDLKPKQIRGRYEFFELLNEEKSNRGGAIRYKAPGPNEPMIDIPVEFFLQGWVHALEDNEIIAYLFLLHQAKLYPEQNSGPGIPLTRFAWAEAFGNSRAYESYRLLSRFGLIKIKRDDRRHADGTVAGLRGSGQRRRIATEPHHYWVDTVALQRQAIPAVTKGLERFLEGENLEEANC